MMDALLAVSCPRWSKAGDGVQNRGEEIFFLKPRAIFYILRLLLILNREPNASFRGPSQGERSYLLSFVFFIYFSSFIHYTGITYKRENGKFGGWILYFAMIFERSFKFMPVSGLWTVIRKIFGTWNLLVSPWCTWRQFQVTSQEQRNRSWNLLVPRNLFLFKPSR